MTALNNLWFRISTRLYFHYERAVFNTLPVVEKAVDNLKQLFNRQ